MNDSPDTTRSLPDPFRRNIVWSICQIVLRWFFGLLLGFRTRGLENLPSDSGALLLVNHQSNFDPLLVGVPLSRPVSFVARSTLFVIREMVARLDHGFLVGMFPEGTRTSDGKIGEFKPGFISLVRRSRRPIVAVGIAGAYESYPRGGLPRPGRVRLVIGKPWQPEEYAEYCERGREAELVAAVRQRVQDCVDEATAWREGRTAETETEWNG